MGQISTDTFKKLVLLYLVGKFKEGVYSGYRFQKTLYFSIKSLENHPFTFQHTRHGQYSYNASKIRESLVTINMLEKFELPDKKDAGYMWTLAKNDVSKILSNLLSSIAPDIADAIDRGVNNCGYLLSSKLVEKAEADDLLLKTPFGQIIFNENLPKMIDVNLSDEDCQDLELNMNPKFINSIRELIQGVESGKIPLEQWRKVDA